MYYQSHKSNKIVILLKGGDAMFSLFVGIIVFIMMLSFLWIMAGKLGVFEFIGNVVLKIKNMFKEEK